MSAQTEFDFEARKEEFRQASATIIERIKKLLRLAADKRGNRHEAERALHLAWELAEKHRVGVESLNLDEESERLMHEHFDVGQRYDRLRRGIFQLLRAYFHVSTCLCGHTMMVVGKPNDVLIARYVHDFLLRAGRERLRAYEGAEKSQRRRVTTNKRGGYIYGFICGLSVMLDGAREAMPLTDSQTALVIAEAAKRESYVAGEVGPTRDLKALPDRKNKSATWIGYLDGRTTNIHQPLTGTAGAPLLLK